MMRRCVLYDKLRLLQWLNLSSSVFQFSLSLVALTAVLKRNDIRTAYFCLHLLVLARRRRRVPWLF
jgi:hypothetical protein